METKAIDVHGHYGVYLKEGKPAYYNEYMTGNAALVAERARRSGIEWTIVSPMLALHPRGGGDPVRGNEEAFATVPRTPGLRQWVVINPLEPETYRQAEAMLQAPWCLGIKIHPEEHLYPISRHGGPIFEFAAKHKATILTHSGDPNSAPADFVPFANSFPGVNLILAHLGNGWDGDTSLQVRAIQAGRHRNLFVDTSSAKSMMSGLIEWGVREVGADRILFGTDTPLYFAASQRARIDQAEIDDADRVKILSGNARALLFSPGKSSPERC